MEWQENSKVLLISKNELLFKNISHDLLHLGFEAYHCNSIYSLSSIKSLNYYGFIVFDVDSHSDINTYIDLIDPTVIILLLMPKYSGNDPENIRGREVFLVEKNADSKLLVRGLVDKIERTKYLGKILRTNNCW